MMMDRVWSKHLSFRAAATEARVWLEKVMHRYCLEDDAVAKSWSKPQRKCGYLFQPLTTAQELDREGREMNNCLATFQHFVERGGCLIYAIKRGNRSVASLELRADAREVGKARIIQLEGPSNTPAPQRIVTAVENWLSVQGPFPLAAYGGIASRPVNAARWAAFWRPYVQAVGAEAAGPFAARPNAATLRAIAEPLDELEYI